MDNQLPEIPIEIKIGFPQSMTDEELESKITELAKGVVLSTHPSFADKYSALCQIALNELNNRHFEKEQTFFKEQSEQNTITTNKSFDLTNIGLTISKRSLTFSKFGLSFSISAFLISAILSGTSVYFANKDDNADTKWQEMQRKLLEKSISVQKTSNQFLDSLLRQNNLVKHNTEKNQSTNTHNKTTQ